MNEFDKYMRNGSAKGECFRREAMGMERETERAEIRGKIVTANVRKTTGKTRETTTAEKGGT